MRRLVVYLLQIIKMSSYIYQHTSWTHFTWDKEKISLTLSNIRLKQGKLIGFISGLGFDLQNLANLETITLDVLKSSEIEGEIFQPEMVRSSVAKRLGIEFSGMIDSDKRIDGVVDMLFDATQNYKEPLTIHRLFSWHRSLFPIDETGYYKISIGKFRTDSKGPMQVVSGGIGYEKVHFQAMDAQYIQAEMNEFLKWFITDDLSFDLIIKAAIAHLWFLTIHPFEDGNGRIARALTDMILAKSDGLPQRFYSMSSQIQKQRKAYYEILERTQKGTSEITPWIEWFLQCFENALDYALVTFDKIIYRHHFWIKNKNITLNNRQNRMLAKILDRFEGNLTTQKWAKICNCSTDTALRDIQDLILKNILEKQENLGRSTSYWLKPFENS